MHSDGSVTCTMATEQPDDTPVFKCHGHDVSANQKSISKGWRLGRTTSLVCCSYGRLQSSLGFTEILRQEQKFLHVDFSSGYSLSFCLQQVVWTTQCPACWHVSLGLTHVSSQTSVIIKQKLAKWYHFTYRAICALLKLQTRQEKIFGPTNTQSLSSFTRWILPHLTPSLHTPQIKSVTQAWIYILNQNAHHSIHIPETKMSHS